MSRRILTSGLYRCDDCGYTVKMTEMRHVWALGAQYQTDESFTACCPKCCPIPRTDPKAKRWNKFRRLGFWQTLKYTWKEMWRQSYAPR